ncbi:unnamed protein product [Ophioblennius macclurei]
MKIHLELTCVGDQRAKGAQFQSTCKLCRESHKTQVWLCFLVLSLLSVPTCTANMSSPEDGQECVKKLKNNHSEWQKSDAMLYAPPIGDQKCDMMSLKCYVLELIMVVEETNPHPHDCIFKINRTIESSAQTQDDGCPKCEAHPLVNVTTFLEKLNNLLERMSSMNAKGTT